MLTYTVFITWCLLLPRDGCSKRSLEFALGAVDLSHSVTPHSDISSRITQLDNMFQNSAVAARDGRSQLHPSPERSAIASVTDRGMYSIRPTSQLEATRMGCG
jgi:hypothetical protein